jgi:MoaA/NifB/PqqE/SkfB family radical SAM enzyme
MIDDIVGLHIEPTNICTLKCPGCPRTRFLDTWPQYWTNQSLDINQLLNFLDIDLQGRLIYMCGNYGDPIYHPEFAEFVRGFKQRGATVSIVTNGSYRAQEWWQRLVTELDAGDTVTFSIDGSPENFTQYRVNGNWPSIKTGIDTCVASKVRTVWKYIPFAFNEHDINTTRTLSQELGIDQFDVEYSDRFDDQTEYLKPTETRVGLRYVPQQAWKSQQLGSVDPHCNNNKEHFITATGHYTPCCWTSDYRFYYKNQFGKNKHMYNINTTTLSQILQQPDTVNFYSTLDQQPGCQFNCPNTQATQ